MGIEFTDHMHPVQGMCGSRQSVAVEVEGGGGGSALVTIQHYVPIRMNFTAGIYEPQPPVQQLRRRGGLSSGWRMWRSQRDSVEHSALSI